MSKIDSFFNLSPLNTTVSRKVISFSDNHIISYLVVLHIHKHKDANVDNVVIKFAQQRGGASRCVCKQYQLTRESSKLLNS